jgi:hypothetical protein
VASRPRRPREAIHLRAISTGATLAGMRVATKGLSYFALASMLSACGSSSGNGSCGKVNPCGGDITGDWTITGACVSNEAATMQIASILPGCTTAMVTSTSVKASGSASFDANMSYTLTRTLTSSGKATIPPSCLMVAGVMLSCAAADALIQQYIATNPMGVQSAHCSGTDTCVCDVTLAPTTTTEMGTYATAGTAVTLTTSTGTVGVADYCVQKGELHITVVNATMPVDAMGNVNADADTVFKKK